MKKMSSPIILGAMFLCLGLMFCLQACKKSDHVLTMSYKQEEKFFTVPESTPATVKRIAAFIKAQNEQHKFVKNLVEKEGFVYWDKADVYVGKLRNRSTIDTLIMLPMVLENDRQVNSFLACKVSGEKIDITLHRGRRYNFCSFSEDAQSLTANNVTLELMYLTKKVFGDSVFLVKDPRLFAKNGKIINKSKILTIRSQKPPVTELNAWLYFNVERCYTYTHDGNEGQLEGVEPGGSADYPYNEWICYPSTVAVFVPDGSGGGGSSATIDPSNGGGGGGNGGDPANPTPYGWWSYDPCQDPNDPQGPISTPDPYPDIPCIDGIKQVWHPLYAIFKVDNITDELVTPCLVAAKSKLPDNMLRIYAAELLIQSEVNAEWSIIFNEDHSIVNSNGAPGIANSHPDPNPAAKVWHVNINPTFWELGTAPNSTQEVAGAVILHEIIHGCIYVYKEKYGLTTLSNFTTHQSMFVNFILIMRKTLQNAYGISETDATALALSGLDGVLRKEYTGSALTSFSTLYNQYAIDNYGLSIPDAHTIYQQYNNGTKGTKCFP